MGIATARRQGQFLVQDWGILGHISPVGWHWGPQGLIGMGGLLVAKGRLHYSIVSLTASTHSNDCPSNLPTTFVKITDDMHKEASCSFHAAQIFVLQHLKGGNF